MNNLLFYIFFVIIVIIIVIYVSIRIKYGFWYFLPVFHSFNLKYYLFPCGIIQHQLPKENKFTNFKEIETKPFDKCSDLKLNQFVNFIKTQFYNEKGYKYIYQKNNIIPYFIGHNSMSFFSFFNKDLLLQDLNDLSVIEDKKIISVITSRPITIQINKKKREELEAYYFDYLCINKSYIKNEVESQIIQTHEYNQRYLNKSIVVSLFKREGKFTGIVPLCSYNIFCFSCHKWSQPELLDANYSFIECNNQNIHYLMDFLKNTEIQSKFDIFITTEMYNWIELLKTNNIFIYYIIDKSMLNTIISVYFFKKSCMIIDKEKEALTCFASIKSKSCNEKIFINGFKNICWNIIKKNEFGYLLIEKISDNDLIIQNLFIKTFPFFVSYVSYFFYNFAYYTFKPKKVFIFV